MKFKVIIVPAVAIALAGVIGVLAQDFDDNIHPPLRFPTKSVPYEPERIIRMTLHDYVGGGMGGRKDETTGRYVTFGLPMKFLDLAWVFPDQSPASIRTYTGWDPSRSGSQGSIISIHDPNGNAPRGWANSSRFIAKATPFASAKRGLRSPELIAARQSGMVFDGYKRRAKPGQTYWLGKKYCGFDVFERDYPRYWHLQADAIDGVEVPDGIVPPFDHARVFGLPDDNGGYRLRVECEDSSDSATGSCFVDRAFNDYIAIRYLFDGSLLCQIEDVVKAHLDLLRQSVVEEEQSKNEKWRNR